MTTYRFKFSKYGNAKFTGHLDVLQTFQRTIKRAQLPIAYSQGFNPHQQLSFALPLSLGYTSTGEYGDFKLTEYIEPKEVIESLNKEMPDGFLLTEVIVLKEGVKNTMASVCAARYKVFFDESIKAEDIKNNLKGFCNQEKIIVMKKTKRDFKETDIKPDILEIYDESSDEGAVLGMVVSAGSTRNLKPESVALGFSLFLGKEFNVFKTGFMREEMYMEQEGSLVSLGFGVGRK